MKYTSHIGKFSAAALLAAFVLTFSTAVKVQAQPVPPESGNPTGYTLADVNNNNSISITNGNLIFSDFQASESGKAIGLNNVAIQSVGYGILFQTGNWLVPHGTNEDLSIFFIVSSLNGAPITDVSSEIAAQNDSNGGVISLSEPIATVGPVPGGGGGNSISDLALAIGGIEATNVVLSPNWNSLYIHKDFQFDDTDATTGYLSGSDIVQTYITTTPEPSTYAMLVSGLAGLGFMIRRRK